MCDTNCKYVLYCVFVVISININIMCTLMWANCANFSDLNHNTAFSKRGTNLQHTDGSPRFSVDPLGADTLLVGLYLCGAGLAVEH